MNCKHSREYHFLSLEKPIDNDTQYKFDEHLSHCVSCQAFVSLETNLTNALKQYPTQVVPKRLLTNVMHKISTDQKIKRYRIMSSGFGMALAASLFIAIMMPGYFNIFNPTANNPITTITMSINSQRTINIVFDSPESVANATITLSLPNHIHLAGYENKQNIQWSAKLNAGKNTLKLPLIASNSGSGILQSTLEINGKTKNITLLVNVSQDKMSSDITYKVIS